MKIGGIVFRCGTTFNEVQVSALLDNNERMLKLSGTLCVQAKIALQRIVKAHAGRHIDKGSARPNGIMKCRKFVVGRRNEGTEVLLDHRFPLGIM